MWWLSWDKLCQHKKVGGLGFRALSEFNQVLVAKQAWRILKSTYTLLGRVLKAKYFPSTPLMECMLVLMFLMFGVAFCGD